MNPDPSELSSTVTSLSSLLAKDTFKPHAVTFLVAFGINNELSNQDEVRGVCKIIPQDDSSFTQGITLQFRCVHPNVVSSYYLEFNHSDPEKSDENVQLFSFTKKCDDLQAALVGNIESLPSHRPLMHVFKEHILPAVTAQISLFVTCQEIYSAIEVKGVTITWTFTYLVANPGDFAIITELMSL